MVLCAGPASGWLLVEIDAVSIEPRTLEFACRPIRHYTPGGYGPNTLGTTRVLKEGLMMSTSTYSVLGMTCGHCADSVREEVSGLPGVTGVEVDLASGTLSVTSESAVSRDAVRAAAEEAGYQLADG